MAGWASLRGCCSPTAAAGARGGSLRSWGARPSPVRRSLGGLTYALDGGIQQVADKVFLLTPRNVEVSAEQRAQLIEKGFFNQS